MHDRQALEIGCLSYRANHPWVPALFELMMPKQASRTCKVTWRDDKRLGVHFRKGSLLSRTDEVIE